MPHFVTIAAPIPLPSLKLHTQAYITAIDTDELRLALLKMGVSIGNQFQLSDIAPLGDPIAIAINGTKISLRKSDAAHIWVTAQP